MKKALYFTFLLFLALGSCKKLITADFPPNQLTTEKVFSDTTSVISATNNLYTLMGTVDANFVRYAGLYTDELKTTTVSATLTEFSTSSLTPLNSSVLSVWQNLYATIYRSNAIINSITSATSLPQPIKDRCLGEAKFVRGYCYLLLVQLWGDIPLNLMTDVSKSALAYRSPVVVVQDQIIADLTDASLLLTAVYHTGSKITPNKFAALGFLSKAALFKKDYQLAASCTSTIINSANYQLLSNLNLISTINNSEAIFQLWNAQGFSTLNSVVTSGVPPTQLSPQLLSAFEPNDLRKVSWIGSDKVSSTQYFFPYKYKLKAATTGTNAEYTTYLRLGEIYLIRAEARANTGDLSGAIADINTIRSRAGLPGLNLSTQDQVLTALLQERRVELFNECGNRLFDLNRFGLIDVTLTALKPLWKPTGKLFPVPQSEVLINPNLTQNNGY